MDVTLYSHSSVKTHIFFFVYHCSIFTNWNFDIMCNWNTVASYYFLWASNFFMIWKNEFEIRGKKCNVRTEKLRLVLTMLHEVMNSYNVSFPLRFWNSTFPSLINRNTWFGPALHHIQTTDFGVHWLLRKTQ